VGKYARIASNQIECDTAAHSRLAKAAILGRLRSDHPNTSARAVYLGQKESEMRRLIVAVLSAGLIVSAVACTGEDPVPYTGATCLMQSHDAKGSTSAKHFYQLEAACTTTGTPFIVHGSAEFDTSKNEASEVVKFGGTVIEDTWLCRDDPWTNSDTSCSSPKINSTSDGNLGGFDDFLTSTVGKPLTAGFLKPDDVTALNADLQAAILKASITPTPNPLSRIREGGESPAQILQGSEPTHRVTEAGGAETNLSQFLTPTPTQPVSQLNGPLTLSTGKAGNYPLIVPNFGTPSANDPIDVTITLGGVLTLDGIAEPLGLNCTPPTQKGPVHCFGALAAATGPTVTFVIEAESAYSGKGTLTIMVDSKHAFAGGATSKTLTVTVTSGQ
jgi:hypothetical protein